MTVLRTATRGRCGLCHCEKLERLPVPRQTVGGQLGELAERGEVGLVRCRQCDFEFVEPRPDDLALAGFYQAQDYTAHEPVDDAAAVRRAEHQLAQVEAAGGKLDGAWVLDVGCGGGQFLAAARQRGARVVGVDPAAHAHHACHRQGIEIAPQLDDLGARRFDGIAMSHVLEHVPDVLSTLVDLRERLAAGGWLCLEVPNRESLRARLTPALVTRLGADERHRAFPIHLSYFTPETLRQALGVSGFVVAAMTTTGLGVNALWPRWMPTREGGAKSAKESAAPRAVGASSSGVSGIRTRLRAEAKRRYFDALLGENLIAIARPR